MKRCLSMLLAVALLLSCVVAAVPTVHAAKKDQKSRAIAIVFDNSGSMYEEGKMAWCQATYAMEVFASMLNKGDTLLIYPMHPITVGGQEYTMDNPFRITDASQASMIREIYTTKPLGTPIESVDAAAQGLKGVSADEKYMIVLTDGDSFYKDGYPMSADNTRKELDSRIQSYAGKDMNIMYLGIYTGNDVVVPDTPESEYFVKKVVDKSEEVLSTLTEMCNKIFGRDTMPKNRVTGNSVTFDVSLSKMIVFVQGQNIADLKVTDSSGKPVGEQVSSAATKYAVHGSAGRYDNIVSDTSLQGMIVTYTDCAAGKCNINYSGTATSIEVYYEPDADLAFVFNDANGNTVDPNALYEGEYVVSFGMKDARTGKLIESDLLGKTKYQGCYYIKGEKHEFSSDKYSDSVSVPLKMDDEFKADLTVTYLSGYTISKDSSAFGWPEGGIKVAPRPAGNLTLEISGGQDKYSLQDLDEGAPYTVKVFYDGVQLVGDALKSVELKWDENATNVKLEEAFAEDHYTLTLVYKDPERPETTVCGECTVPMSAFYTPPASTQAQAGTALTYNIEDDMSPLWMELLAPEDYIVISELGQSQPITVKLTMKGAPLSEEDFALVELKVETGGIAYECTPNPQDSSYTIKLLETEGIGEGDYTVTATGVYTDHIGRQWPPVEESAVITLSILSIGAKIALFIAGLLLLILLLWLLSRIPALPTYVKEDSDAYSLLVGGRDVTPDATMEARRSGKQIEVMAEYNSFSANLSITNIRPGPNSYIVTPQTGRSIEVKPNNVSCPGDVTKVQIEDATFVIDPESGWLKCKDQELESFVIGEGSFVKIEGTMQDGIKPKSVVAKIPLNFKR